MTDGRRPIIHEKTLRARWCTTARRLAQLREHKYGPEWFSHPDEGIVYYVDSVERIEAQRASLKPLRPARNTMKASPEKQEGL